MTHEGMKIYCQSCREYCLDATEDFVPGGPYNGSMFAPPSQARYDVDHFMFQEWVVHGDLFCPRCEQQFIVPSTDGQNEIILTEYGLLEPLMKTIDTSRSIINDDMTLQTVSYWNPGDGTTETPIPLDSSTKTAPDIYEVLFDAFGIADEPVAEPEGDGPLSNPLPPGVSVRSVEDMEDDPGEGLPPGVVEDISEPEGDGFPFHCDYCDKGLRSAGGKGSHERACGGKLK